MAGVLTHADAADLLALARRVVHDPRPAPGGHSGESFAGTLFGKPVHLRLYVRHPHRAAVDAALHRRLRGRLPVPALVDVQPDPGRGLPPHLVTARVAGVRVDQLLGQDWSLAGARGLGRQLARVVGVLAEERFPAPGELVGPEPAVRPWPAQLRSLTAWYDAQLAGLRLAGLGPEQAPALRTALAAADARLAAGTAQASLVHGDLNGTNVLADPDRGRLLAVVDWEHAHAGDPLADVGNLLREARAHAGTPVGAAFAEGLVEALDRDRLDPSGWRRRAEDLDLFALLELAARPDPDATAPAPVRRAREQLRLLGR